ncbi:probable tubulin polyglutamylase TTLL9 [Prorops nasuta]|uniref:probable tubulin polyglutamylase TTLL9 n=1 Tax=Prorops nasuta TaxID=863751 RepID=UPI0034CE39BB
MRCSKARNVTGALKDRRVVDSERSRKICNESNKKLDCDDDKVVKFRCDFPSTQLKVMLARGWKQVVDPDDSSWRLWWCETSDVRAALDRKLDPSQKIPHFRNHYELTRKNFLCRNLKRYKKLLSKSGKLLEAQLCDSMPITFELPSEYRMLVEEYHKQQGATWIVKPANRSQGNGIFLFRKLKDLADWKSKESNKAKESGDKEAPPETFIVQKYVDNPYLLAGKKFDLRIYVLVTSFYPLKVWLAREGFARLSAELFDLSNIGNCKVHLTNMAIQLRAREKNAEKQDFKWALSKVREYLTKKHGEAAMEDLFQRIAGVIMASLLAVQPVIIQEKNSFELYGYDVLLDECLKPWLLEVNASPALTGTDSEDYRLKFDLLDDVLNILDLEARLSGRESRVGGFDLLWEDGPVFYTDSTSTEQGSPTKKLNIFLGAGNNRTNHLRLLHQVLEKQFRK